MTPSIQKSDADFTVALPPRGQVCLSRDKPRATTGENEPRQVLEIEYGAREIAKGVILPAPPHDWPLRRLDRDFLARQ